MEALKGLRVAILVTDGFEHVELVAPRKALDEAGAKTSIVSPKSGGVRSWKFTEWGEELPVDAALDRARPEDVVDRGLVSSRKPDDIPAFNREMLKLFGQALEAKGRAA